jgi:hypothetical protein
MKDLDKAVRELMTGNRWGLSRAFQDKAVNFKKGE